MGPPPKVTRQQILSAMEKWQGDVTRVAEFLDVSRTVLYRHMKRHGINPDDYRIHDLRPEADVTFSGHGVVTVLAVETSDIGDTPVALPSRVTCVQKEPVAKFHSIMSRVGEKVGQAVGSVVDDFSGAIRRKTVAPPRLRPDQERTLLRLRSQLQAKIGAELLDSSILQDIFDWAIGAYSERILSYDPLGAAPLAADKPDEKAV
jgi:hypothetical protein